MRAVLSRAFTDMTFIRMDDKWKPRSEADGEREYVLTAHGYVPAGDLLLALHRCPLSRNVAFLSGLIEVYEWAQEAGSWIDLAAEASRRFRDDGGHLSAPDFDAMYAFSGQWPVSSRHCCNVVVDGDQAYAHDAVLVEAAPLDPTGADTAPDHDEDEEIVELAEDLVPKVDTREETSEAEEAPGTCHGVPRAEMQHSRLGTKIGRARHLDDFSGEQRLRRCGLESLGDAAAQHRVAGQREPHGRSVTDPEHVRAAQEA